MSGAESARSFFEARVNVPAAVVDLLVYVVVLNLFVQFVPEVITETFSVSLFTSALLLVVIELVHLAEAPLRARVKTSTSTAGKVLNVLALWLVLAGSKFVVLELVAFVFDDSVQLGGFFAVTGLIIVLMVSQRLVRRVLDRPAVAGPPPVHGAP
jgi:hypothetical protein